MVLLFLITIIVVIIIFFANNSKDNNIKEIYNVEDKVEVKEDRYKWYIKWEKSNRIGFPIFFKSVWSSAVEMRNWIYSMYDTYTFDCNTDIIIEFSDIIIKCNICKTYDTWLIVKKYKDWWRDMWDEEVIEYKDIVVIQKRKISWYEWEAIILWIEVEKWKKYNLYTTNWEKECIYEWIHNDDHYFIDNDYDRIRYTPHFISWIKPL